MLKVMACIFVPQHPVFFSNPYEFLPAQMNTEEPRYDWLFACQQADRAGF